MFVDSRIVCAITKRSDVTLRKVKAQDGEWAYIRENLFGIITPKKGSDSRIKFPPPIYDAKRRKYIQIIPNGEDTETSQSQSKSRTSDSQKQTQEVEEVVVGRIGQRPSAS